MVVRADLTIDHCIAKVIINQLDSRDVSIWDGKN